MRAWLTLIAGLVLLLAPRPLAQSPVVYTAEVDGIIQPVVAEYLRGAIAEADAAGAALLVITLRTPGGLLDTTSWARDSVSGNLRIFATPQRVKAGNKAKATVTAMAFDGNGNPVRGRVVFAGTPRDLLADERSLTAVHLREHLG